MDLPLDLRTALDDVLGTVKSADLNAAAREVSRRYRGASDGSQALRSNLDVLAYGAYRLPATYAAVGAALVAVRAVMPDWHPVSLLDVGAGPGTASWAAAELWRSLEDVELIEQDERMIAFGRQLMDHAGRDPLKPARWRQSDLLDQASEEPRDLVIMSYALREVDESQRQDLLEYLLRQTSGVLALIEPGTPAGFEVIRAARAHLIELGARVVAPCPHSSSCPMPDGDWCHFSRRLSRSRAHRDAKGVTIGYEDEKFSYVAVTGLPVDPVHNRVLRHPQIRPGHIHLELCTREGLQHCVVTRGDKERFREARHTSWGDAVHAPEPA